MNTLNRIIETISKYNDDHNGQVNLASPYARTDLAELIYDAVMKQNISAESYTINNQDTFNFSNKDTDKPK